LDRHSRSRNRRSNSSSNSKTGSLPSTNLQQRLAGTTTASGPRPRNCIEPRSFRQRTKLEPQSPTSAHVNTTATDRIFVTDRTCKFRFLIDTSSDLCVFPLMLISQRRSLVNYDLPAANGTTIPTYGWLPPSLNLRLRREFTWRFVVSDVTQPIIGEDFLFHFGLLVDLSTQPPAGRRHVVVCLCPSRQFSDPQRQSHQR
jgi:hypothetical protein